MSESAVGRPNRSMSDSIVRVKFDSALIEFERSLNVAGEVELAPSRAGLQRLGRRAERLFQRLIEARQRSGGVSQLLPKAHGRRSQLMDCLITSANVRPLLSQGRAALAVEGPQLQVITVAGLGGRLGEQQLAR